MHAPVENLRDIYTSASSEVADVRALGVAIGSVRGLSEVVLRYTHLFYGRVAGNVTDATRAAVILGPRVVGHIAVLHQLVCASDELGLPDAVASRLWSDWIHRALAARLFAEKTRGVHPDLAFTAGLALEWGIAPVLAEKGQHLKWLGQVRTHQGTKRTELERQMFGETHVESFARAARQWGLPEWLPAIVKLRRMTVDPASPPETAALHRAAAWGDEVAEAITSPAAGPALEDCVRSAVALGMTDEDAWVLIRQVIRLTPATASMLDVPCAPQPSVEDLMERKGDYQSIQLGGEWVALVQAENDRLRDQINDLKAQLDRAEKQDRVTGLPGHDAFIELASAAVERCRDQGDALSVILVDLDDFVELNGRFGHKVGNQLLALVATRLRGVTRADNVLARVGPDAFAILVPGEVRTGQVVAERARAAVEALHLDTQGRRIQVTANVVGVPFTSFPNEADGGAVLTTALQVRKTPAGRVRNKLVWSE
jgi:diguanylate cyclase (GGDEF)-like protein